MQLQDFFDYKNQLMKDLLTSEEIVKLIDKDIPFERAEELAYKNVFPMEYIPDTTNHGVTYICFDVDIMETYNSTFLAPVIYIWVFTHRTNLRLPEGGVLTDKLCSEICKVINGSRMYGMGELNLSSVKRFAPQTDFQGKCMTFEAIEVNRYHTPVREIPASRKG